MAKHSKPSSKRQEIPAKHPFRFDLFLIEIFGRFGITGACILTVIYVFLQFGTTEQKNEFIDKFILLKIVQNDNYVAIYIAIILVTLFVFQNLFFRKKDKLKQQRILELENHVKELESKIK